MFDYSLHTYFVMHILYEKKNKIENRIVIQLIKAEHFSVIIITFLFTYGYSLRKYFVMHILYKKNTLQVFYNILTRIKLFIFIFVIFHSNLNVIIGMNI